jgi:hypothetical protein
MAHSGCPARVTEHSPEVADVLRDHAYRLPLTRALVRVVSAIVKCRTAALGDHWEDCPACGFARKAYDSCRNRHCPKCQILKQELWAEAHERRLLPTRYFHVVFTIAAELRPLFHRAPRVCYEILFHAVSQTLIEAARKRGFVIGFTAVLHTWSQLLRLHPHIHCIVPAGGLSLDLTRWVDRRRFLLPIPPLRILFTAKLLSGLEQALRSGEIPCPLADGLALLARASRKDWGIRIKPSLAGPQHVVRYLSRYVHRIAIANSRIVAYDGHTVTFRYKDRADGNKAKTTQLSGERFCRRFLTHVLPPRFVRIRHYGLLATRATKMRTRCHEIFGTQPASPPPKDASWADAFQRLFGRDPLLCPACHQARLVLRPAFRPLRL